MIPLCIPTLNRGHDMLQRLLDSVFKPENEMIPNPVVVLDNGNQFPPEVSVDISDADDGDPIITEALSKGDPVVIFNPGTNMGVAGSWNWFLNNVLMPEKVMLISNDDIVFFPETVKLMYDTIMQPDKHFVLGQGGEYSLFALTQELFETLDGFDEAFFPAYFEDNDWHYRMRLKGYEMTPTNIPYGHDTSSTLKAFSPQEERLHHANFRTNRNYYIQKWGGPPREEKFKTPFGR